MLRLTLSASPSVARRVATIAVTWAALASLIPAQAMMAGKLPDTPAARVDANTTASKWSSAVSVIVNGQALSGVVIAPNYVLTASHVVAGAAASQVQVQVNVGPTGTIIAAAAITIFPTAAFPYDDLAIIQLSQSVPAGVTIYPIYQTTPTSSFNLNLVGYGISANGDDGTTNFVGASASVKRAGQNSLDTVFTHFNSDTQRSSFYMFDFDSPTANGGLGGASLGNTIETELNTGDSGSPAYATIGGTTYLVGINTFLVPGPSAPAGGSTFLNWGGGMLLSDSRFISWIKQVTGNTIVTSPYVVPDTSGDVPLPWWALGALGGSLITAVTRRSSRRPG